MPTKIAPADSRHFRFAVADHTFGVDATTGKLTGLQLMAAGREAKGHGIYIDEITLETGAECVKERGGRLKAYVTHDHSGPCSWRSSDMDEASSELNIPGFFSEITVKKSQLNAGSFEFYDTFKANYKSQFDQIVEMARKTPELLGISVECWGYLVYVAKDGTEYSGEPDGVELLYNGMPVLRITDLWAAAFVSDGAATDGLFSKFSSLFGGKRTKEERAGLAAALAKFAAEFEAAKPKPNGTVPLLAPSKTNPESTPETKTMKIIADLKAKLGADAQKFAAAMAIVGNTPTEKLATLTVAEVETALGVQETQTQITNLTTERDTLKGNVTTLTTERDTLKGQVTTLTTERDTWKGKYEKFKASGKDSDVDLGAGGGNGGNANAEELNPWSKKSKNLSRQAEITKADPVKAAALKEAARSEK
jgi:hypothetical protein